MKDSVFRFKKDFILILATGISGSFFQLGAIGQVMYYARALETGKAIDILGHHIEPRSPDFLYIYISGLLFLLLCSCFLIYYSNNKIIRLSRSYMGFCSRRVFSMIAELRGICSPGVLTLYNDVALLKLASTDARFCGRILRLVIRLVQPTFTFVIAFGALFYINSKLTLIVFLITGVSLFFHYRNNLKGASSSKKMEDHAPGASKERRKILKAALRSGHLGEDFFKWMGEYYADGEIRHNLDGYQARFQTIEKAKFINDMFMAIMLALVALILGGSAIMHNAFWGRLIIYLLALKYCLNHLKTSLVSFTSINRFYPQLSRYFCFIDFLDMSKRPKKTQAQRCKVDVYNSPFENSEPSAILKKGDIIGLAGPLDVDFYSIPIRINCLLGYRKRLVEEVLKSMQVIMETEDGYLNALSLKRLLCCSSDYSLPDLRQELRSVGLAENRIMQLPEDLGRPISREEWDRIEPEMRYTISLLSAIHSNQQWIVIDKRVFQHLSPITREHLLKKLRKKITLILFDAELEGLGTYGESIVAIVDGQHLIGLGNVPWVQSQYGDIQERMNVARQYLIPSQKKGKDEEEDDELDDDI